MTDTTRSRSEVERTNGWDPEWSPARDLERHGGWRGWFGKRTTRRYADGSDRFFAEELRRIGPDAIAALDTLRDAGWSVNIFASGRDNTLVVSIRERSETT